MPKAGKLSITRRAIMGVLALSPLPVLAAVGADEELLALKDQWDELRARIDALPSDEASIDEINRLCEDQDAIAVRMSRLPTLTKAGATAKAEVVQAFFQPASFDHHDEALFDQVVGWLKG